MAEDSPKDSKEDFISTLLKNNRYKILIIVSVFIILSLINLDYIFFAPSPKILSPIPNDGELNVPINKILDFSKENNEPPLMSPLKSLFIPLAEELHRYTTINLSPLIPTIILSQSIYYSTNKSDLENYSNFGGYKYKHDFLFKPNTTYYWKGKIHNNFRTKDVNSSIWSFQTKPSPRITHLDYVTQIINGDLVLRFNWIAANVDDVYIIYDNNEEDMKIDENHFYNRSLAEFANLSGFIVPKSNIINNPKEGNYTLIAKNNAKEIDKKSVYIHLPSPLISFISDKNSTKGGEDVKLNWSIQNATEAKFYENGALRPDVDPKNNDHIIVSPIDDTTYTISATNSWTGNYPISKKIVIKVTPNIKYFHANNKPDGEVIEGDNVELEWEVVGAHEIVIDKIVNGGQPIPVWNMVVRPEDNKYILSNEDTIIYANTNFTLSAKKSGYNTASNSTIVKIKKCPPIPKIKISPIYSRIGDRVNFNAYASVCSDSNRIVEYSWISNKSETLPSVTNNPNMSYPFPVGSEIGWRTITLKVKDDKGRTSEAQQNIYVE